MRAGPVSIVSSFHPSTPHRAVPRRNQSTGSRPVESSTASDESHFGKTSERDWNGAPFRNVANMPAAMPCSYSGGGSAPSTYAPPSPSRPAPVLTPMPSTNCVRSPRSSAMSRSRNHWTKPAGSGYLPGPVFQRPKLVVVPPCSQNPDPTVTQERG